MGGGVGGGYRALLSHMGYITELDGVLVDSLVRGIDKLELVEDAAIGGLVDGRL